MYKCTLMLACNRWTRIYIYIQCHVDEMYIVYMHVKPVNVYTCSMHMEIHVHSTLAKAEVGRKER